MLSGAKDLILSPASSGAKDLVTKPGVRGV